VRHSVLVVDDSTDIHELVQIGLIDEPVDLHSSFSGTEGLETARRLLPDLILLDVDMPKPDGFEVCRNLKADPMTMGIPVIFLTGASSTEEKIRGLELGAIDYVTKPFDPAELRARVAAALRTKRLLDLLAQRAMLDGLTGLWNRAYFDQRVNGEVSLARRNGTPLSCILLDADHFKQVNDNFGHPAGDRVLQMIAQVLSDACRKEDVVCRYGGEEFAILAPGVEERRGAELAERLRQSIATARLTHRGTELQVTCSIGVADTTGPATASLVERADQALYHAKRAGRNRVVIASECAVAALAG